MTADDGGADEPAVDDGARRFWTGLAVVALFGLVVRVAYIAVSRQAVQGDGTYYHAIAGVLADGKGFVHPQAYLWSGLSIPWAPHPLVAAAPRVARPARLAHVHRAAALCHARRHRDRRGGRVCRASARRRARRPDRGGRRGRLPQLLSVRARSPGRDARDLPCCPSRCCSPFDSRISPVSCAPCSSERAAGCSR